MIVEITVFWDVMVCPSEDEGQQVPPKYKYTYTRQYSSKPEDSNAQSLQTVMKKIVKCPKKILTYAKEMTFQESLT
jgi:hypothetical protein